MRAPIRAKQLSMAATAKVMVVCMCKVLAISRSWYAGVRQCLNWYCYSDMGIPIPKTLVIWASSVTLNPEPNGQGNMRSSLLRSRYQGRHATLLRALRDALTTAAKETIWEGDALSLTLWKGIAFRMFFLPSLPSSHPSLDCKTVRIFSYSSTREQSNKRSGMRLKTESETGERR